MNLAEAYGRLAEQAEEASGADLAHPLHGLWTKADAGNSGSPLSPSCVGLAEYVVGSCKKKKKETHCSTAKPSRWIKAIFSHA